MKCLSLFAGTGCPAKAGLGREGKRVKVPCTLCVRTNFWLLLLLLLLSFLHAAREEPVKTYTYLGTRHGAMVPDILHGSIVNAQLNGPPNALPFAGLACRTCECSARGTCYSPVLALAHRTSSTTPHHTIPHTIIHFQREQQQ